MFDRVLIIPLLSNLHSTMFKPFPLYLKLKHRVSRSKYLPAINNYIYMIIIIIIIITIIIMTILIIIFIFIFI